VDSAGDEALYLILADWLEEHDDPRRAELLRLHRRLLATCWEPDEHPERDAQQARLVQLLAEGVQPCVPRRSLPLDHGVEMVFAWLPPGTFRMGNPPNEEWHRDEETQHQVTLTKGFWMGVYPVTQAQWQAVTGNNPGHFKGDDRPVENVSWEDCQAFCEQLSKRDGTRHQSPTESQWEYACRAGTTTPFYFGRTISTDQANYNGNHTYGKGKKGVYRQQTTPVRSFPPNAWGLFDMHGNVYEWCQDWYGPYPNGDLKDPKGENSGEARVLRGGSWFNGPAVCRAACRHWDAPANRDGLYGCRVLLRLD
jgi:uncharacterized protein (TIGR02996 family)